MRLIYAAATVGIALAVSMGAPPANADTGVPGYVQCVGGDAKPPPPGVAAENWFPSLHVIDNDIISGIPSDQVVQRLITMGVKPEDAATRVRCYLANSPH